MVKLKRWNPRDVGKDTMVETGWGGYVSFYKASDEIQKRDKKIKKLEDLIGELQEKLGDCLLVLKVDFRKL